MSRSMMRPVCSRMSLHIARRRAGTRASHLPAGPRDLGVVGEGAHVERDGRTSAISVSSTAQSPLRVVGSRSHAGDSLKQFLAEIGDHELLSMGSSLKLCLVAEGKADIYPRIGPTSEWDTAAAQAVVEAAGGKVTETSGKPLMYNRKESLLNPYFLVFGDSSREWHNYFSD